MIHPSSRQRYRFLTDENVSARVARIIADRGHDVLESRTAVAVGAADAVVANLATREGLMVISHDRDFKRSIAASFADVSQRQVRDLPLIHLRMPGVRSLTRVARCWSLVEAHLDLAAQTGERILRIEIMPEQMVVFYRVPDKPNDGPNNEPASAQP